MYGMLTSIIKSKFKMKYEMKKIKYNAIRAVDKSLTVRIEISFLYSKNTSGPRISE